MAELQQLLDNLDADNLRRGVQFEIIIQWFLKNSPTYRDQLREVWLWDEWSGRWGNDAGIDLVAEDVSGKLWAIQVKAYASNYTVTKADVDTFLSESSRAVFSYRLLIASTELVSRTARRTIDGQEKECGMLLRDALEASGMDWPSSPTALLPVKANPKAPRPHQASAIQDVIDGFSRGERGQLVMACGTGKTLTALFVAERAAAKRTLVLLPSLSLLAQTLQEWTANAAKPFAYLPVCSDETVHADPDSAISTTSELGFPVTTDPGEITTFLRLPETDLVVFATYQSSPRIAEAFKLSAVPEFDLIIADEAHRCAGRVSNAFATVLDQTAIPARRRLFMTATPRFFTGQVLQASKDSDFEVASMDDETTFGPVFHSLSFGEAIESGLLSDYQVAVIGVDDATYLDWAKQGRFVTRDGVTVTDARTLGGQIGLAKAMRRYGLRRTITFHSRVATAKAFARTLPDVVRWMPPTEAPEGVLWADYVSGEMPTGQRTNRLNQLRHLDGSTFGVLANARCLSEGVDVPTLDGVAFVDPRRSEVDIVQAVGRAIRKSPGKTLGTIVIPVFLRSTDDPVEALMDSTFKPVWDVLKALRAHDAQLGDQLDTLRFAIGCNSGEVRIPPKIHLDLPAHVTAQFVSAIEVRLVEQTTSSWEFWLGLMSEYALANGHARVPSEYRSRGFSLGAWGGTQRASYAKGKLDPALSARLEAVPGWAWNLVDDQWERGFASLITYVGREGHARVPQNWVEAKYRLGQWIAVQRRRFIAGQCDTQQIARLQRIPGWSWTPRDDTWQVGLAALTEHVGTHGTSAVPGDLVVNGFSLGRWVIKQRANLRELDPERAGRLEELPGWTWDRFEDKWNSAFIRLLAFANREGHARVPQAHIEDDARLGAWVTQQRQQNKKGLLIEQRKSQLEGVTGWTWNDVDSRWEDAFAMLVAYAEENGTSAVLVDYKDGDVPLGQWARTQRAFFAKSQLSRERAERLASLPGWRWDPQSKQWQYGFEQLSRFASREGHCLVRSGHREENFPLGTWLGNQRAAYARGKLAPDRQELLETLPGWTWRPPRGPRPQERPR